MSILQSRAALAQEKIDMLKKLSMGHLTIVDLVYEHKVRMMQDLVKAGYARDYAGQVGRRVEIRLRIWGITEAGKAVLEQVAMVETNTRQPALPLTPRPPLKIEKIDVVKEAMKGITKEGGKQGFDTRKWFQGTDGHFVPRRGTVLRLIKNPLPLPPAKPEPPPPAKPEPPPEPSKVEALPKEEAESPKIEIPKEETLPKTEAKERKPRTRRPNKREPELF